MNLQSHNVAENTTAALVCVGGWCKGTLLNEAL